MAARCLVVLCWLGADPRCPGVTGVGPPGALGPEGEHKAVTVAVVQDMGTEARSNLG